MKFEQKFSVWFWLTHHKKTADGLVPIYVRVTVDGRRAELSIRRVIEPKYWDSARERVKGHHPRSVEINELIATTHSELSKCFQALAAKQEYVTIKDVKALHMGAGSISLARKTFMTYFKEFIAISKEKKDNGSIGDGRYKRFKVLYNKVESYLHYRYQKTDMFPEDMKLSFLVGFEHYLRTTKNIGHNTTMKYCKDMKQLMGYVVIEEDMHVNRFHPFKCTYKKVKPRYLNEDELTAIENKVLTIPRLDEVRDCFIFSCYTGYAYSDAAALTWENVGKGIDGSLWIMRDRGKTGEVENVPLLPKALAIIEKYKNHPYCKRFNKLLPLNSNVRYNAYLKELGDLCGIKRDVSTHMARHTCATTVLLANDVPIETVKEFLGHNDIRTTQIYAKVVQKKLSNDMNDLKQKLEVRHEPLLKAF